MNPTAVSQFIDKLRDAFEDDDSNAAAKVMESNNVTLIQDQYRAIARGDFAAFVNLLADDIEMEIVGPSAVPFVGSWRGRQQVVDAIGKNFSHLEDQHPEVQSVVAQGDMVVVTAKERGRIKATGRTYEVHWVQYFTFRNGKVVRFRELFDSGAMLDAVRP
jgi:ketosteroid isomerase-like protein